MTNFPVTSLYAIPLAIIFLVLVVQVILSRSNLAVSIGDAGNPNLHERIRRHGNFVEWVPMILILLLVAEARGVSTLWLHAAGALLTLGRLLHPFGLKAGAPTHPLRIAGNVGAMLATVILTICLGLSQFGA